MNIDDYIIEVETEIKNCVNLANYELTFDKKSSETVFISGKLIFRNDSILDFKEFVKINNFGFRKLKYAYNFRTQINFIFRFDNAQDPRAKKLDSFPHHKHLPNGEIIESFEMNLKFILDKIENINL